MTVFLRDVGQGLAVAGQGDVVVFVGGDVVGGALGRAQVGEVARGDGEDAVHEEGV